MAKRKRRLWLMSMSRKEPKRLFTFRRKSNKLGKALFRHHVSVSKSIKSAGKEIAKVGNFFAGRKPKQAKSIYDSYKEPKWKRQKGSSIY